MARTARPTAEQLPLLEQLERAAALRHEVNRLYVALFHRALAAGTRPSIIARYARVSPQAANSMRRRLKGTAPDLDAPESITDALRRSKSEGFQPEVSTG